MPLAICQAGYYIERSGASLNQYMLEYDETFSTVQSQKPGFGWDHHNDTAVTTWEISYSRLVKQNKDVAYLLLACSYLNPEKVMEELVTHEGSDRLEST
ncbi:hypothetical protein ABW20_dc0109413 [Dactylellina cionopaga]|nr:hypothetical protein ABW20_dc0109413 [Dactylellina cionopaga]